MRRKISAAVAAVCLTVLAAGITSCRSGNKNPQKYDEGSTVMYCDEGFQSFMEEEIGVFEYQYPKAQVLVRYMSETDAINSMINDSCKLIVTSTPLTDQQKRYIKNHNKHVVSQSPIAVDAVALIVNKNNSLERLNTSDLRDILTGKIRNWSQLMRVNDNGLDTTQIKVVFDRMGSATVNFIQQKFLNGGNFMPNAFAQATSMEVFKVVENDPSAIGIISVSWLGEDLDVASSDQVKANMNEDAMKSLENEQEIVTQKDFSDKIKVLAMGGDDAVLAKDFYLPYQEYIYDREKYPLVRIIYLTSAAGQGTVGKTFYDFVTGFVGQKILTRTGVLPYKVAPRVVELQ